MVAPTTMTTGKIGELHVFGELLHRGVNPYVPLVDREGIDAVVRRRDGTYLELQIKTINTPQYPRWFGARISRPRNQLFMVCVTLATVPSETWIIPSHVFKTHSTYSSKIGVYDLDLDATKRGSDVVRKKLLAEYCEAWHLLTEDAEIATEGPAN
jgi:hypothetical protein